MSNLWQQLNGDMSTIVENVRRSLVQISNGRGGAGAGTIWHADGLIVTNAHVIAGHQALKVTLPDGRTLPARVLATAREHDVAVLAVDANNLPTIALGDSKMLRPGQWVVALGHPWGVLGAATAGIVIDTGTPPEMPGNRGEFIQVGLHLRPGHSGGPLVDVQGKLIGLNTMITGPEVGLAVPVHTIKAFLRQALGSPSPAPAVPEPTFI
ncbi:MAG: trypsin-like peptidase domain-containing protein [Chloroflexi bacterium]|nr:trypsin-like peptidase domain-containing protein [Chloroflexota bacterium]